MSKLWMAVHTGAAHRSGALNTGAIFLSQQQPAVLSSRGPFRTQPEYTED